MPRTLTTLFFCAGFAFLLFGGRMFAQPQAPIEWSEPRLLQDASDDVDVLVAWSWADGDTIVLMGATDPPGSAMYATVSISGDNGESWSPWHEFNGGPMGQSAVCWATRTSGGIHISAETPTELFGLHTTRDLGMSWEPPWPALPLLGFLDAIGDTIFGAHVGPSQRFVSWTGDEGHTYAPSREVFPEGYHTSGGALGRNYYHVINAPFVSFGVAQLYYTRVPLWEGEAEASRVLNQGILHSYNCSIDMDTSGVGMIATVAMYDYPIPDWGAIVVTKTYDDGTTWSPVDTLTPAETAFPLIWPAIAHCGKLWAIAWADTMQQPPFEHMGVWLAFTANSGRSWYPTRQIRELFTQGDYVHALDVRPDYVRLYTAHRWYQGQLGMYYQQVEGSIQTDSLPPVVVTATEQPMLVAPGEELTFQMNALDNDSLWKTDLILWANDSEDSLVLALEADSPGHYSVGWTAPDDTSLWFCYYRLEDMWENVATTTIDTFQVGALSATRRPVELATHISLLAFPNPFNSSTTLSFDLPFATSLTLTVFDITGREVMTTHLGSLPAGTHTPSIDASQLPSGIYFARLTSSSLAPLRAGKGQGIGVTRKLALIR
jgi:hypothetical protein